MELANRKNMAENASYYVSKTTQMLHIGKIHVIDSWIEKEKTVFDSRANKIALLIHRSRN